MVKQKRLFVSMLLIGMLLVMVVPSVSAYRLLCMVYGESIPDSVSPLYTCWHDLCQICVDDLDRPAAPYRCNGFGACEVFGGSGGGEIDRDPPDVIVTSPSNDQVFSSRAVLFYFSSNAMFV